MAIWLVKAKPKYEKLQELRARINSGELSAMRPFGTSLDDGLRNAKLKREDGYAYWEEEDYCRPPLAQERKAVLDDYFYDLSVVEDVRENGKAWLRIDGLPSIWNYVKQTKKN